MRLYDLAQIIRSKNAGPFTLTIDLMFTSAENYIRALDAPGFTVKAIARLYNVADTRVFIRPFERILTIKVTMPRPGPSSGAPGDRDVYGCQQHFPLADIEV